MKITKRTFSGKKTWQRALTMEETVTLIKNKRTKEKINTFREKLQRAYPYQKYTFTQKLPLLLFADAFRKDEMKEYNGWVLLEISYLRGKEEADMLRNKMAEYPQTLFAMRGNPYLLSLARHLFR